MEVHINIMKNNEDKRIALNKMESGAPAQLKNLLTNKPENDGWCSPEFTAGCKLSDDEKPQAE